MTKVIFNTASTLNGYLADENDSLEWLFKVPGPEMPDLEGFQKQIGVYVSGSTTYEWVLGHDKLLENPEKWTEFFGGRPYFVFTTRELPVPEGADVTFVSGTVADSMEQISGAANGKDIHLYGGGELVGQFYDEGFLDEIQISFTPVTLATGALILPRNIDSDNLALENVERFGQFAHLSYSVKK